MIKEVKIKIQESRIFLISLSKLDLAHENRIKKRKIFRKVNTLLFLRDNNNQLIVYTYIQRYIQDSLTCMHAN